jgi:succinate dehydrogenase / fumarate reductase, flavoprotein subunit
MWSGCGVVRDAEGLRETLEVIAELKEAVPHVDVRETSEGWEDLARLCALEAGIVTAEATVRGALAREESRGAHTRRDFPDPSEDLRNIRFRLDDGQLVQHTEPVKPVRAELREWVAQDEGIPVAGRLLE